MAKRSKKKVSLPTVKALKHEAVLVPANENAPTLERLAQAGHVVATHLGTRRTEIVGSRAESPFGADGIARLAQAPLDRYAAKRRLDQDPERNRELFGAGDQLRQHWYRGGLSAALGSVDLNRTGGGNGHPAWMTPTAESAAYHRDRYRRARDSMEAGHFAVLYAVCCEEKSLEETGRAIGIGNRDGAAAVALDRLQRGLAFLAVLWGIRPPRPGNDNLTIDPTLGSRIVRGDEVDDIIGRLMQRNAVEALQQAG